MMVDQIGVARQRETQAATRVVSLGDVRRGHPATDAPFWSVERDRLLLGGGPLWGRQAALGSCMWVLDTCHPAPGPWACVSWHMVRRGEGGGG